MNQDKYPNIHLRPSGVTNFAEWSQESRKYILSYIEDAGRICYGSEKMKGEDTASHFIDILVKKGHLSVIEHVSASFKIVCTRACSHQIVRHRLCSYSQESQRYCSYTDRVLMIYPPAQPYSEDVLEQLDACALLYKDMLKRGDRPQKARLVLPNATGTTLVVTANLRQWRHMIKLRSSPQADDEIRWIFREIGKYLYQCLPEVFEEVL